MSEVFQKININPLQKSTGDCVIRAISLLLDKSWDEVYIMLCVYGYMMKDWGNSNSVWDRYLRDQGFKKYLIPDTCPDCYTIYDFCKDNPVGDYLLSTGTHVVCVKNGGVLLDSWDSSNEVPLFYYSYS